MSSGFGTTKLPDCQHNPNIVLGSFRTSVLEGNTVWVDLVYGLRVCFEGEQESGSSNYGSSE